MYAMKEKTLCQRPRRELRVPIRGGGLRYPGRVMGRPVLGHPDTHQINGLRPAQTVLIITPLSPLCQTVVMPTFDLAPGKIRALP
jgi:hypothetical protein